MDEKNELREEQMEAGAAGENSGDGGGDNLVIKLKKPYLFDHKEYAEIDLSGLEDMTAADMIAVEKQYDNRNPGINVMPELKVGYAVLMAARAAQLPIEFFTGLPQKEAVKVKNRVMSFLFGSD